MPVPYSIYSTVTLLFISPFCTKVDRHCKIQINSEIFLRRAK